MVSAASPEILADVASYYSTKLAAHGATPRGVDWNGVEGQRLRFEQLMRIVETDGQLSVSDIGCGYGALFEFLVPRYPQLRYVGCDVSASMIEAARARFVGDGRAFFAQGAEPPERADYCVASGIFNVRLGHSALSWQAYILSMLDVLDRSSRRGFAFNCLTSYSDPQRMRADLHYADPMALFDHCKRRYARRVALLHDYDLYEFTVLVRKDS